MSNITPTIWQTTVMTAFKTYWNGTSHSDVQIASPNRPFDRARVDADTFIQWFMAGDPAGQKRYSHSTLNNHFSREGTWTFTANVRTELKSSLALDLLDSIGLFYETAVLDGGYFKSVGAPIPLGDDGAWYQVSLSSGWIYFSDRQSTLT